MTDSHLTGIAMHVHDRLPLAPRDLLILLRHVRPVLAGGNRGTGA
jgi:hypothetical protein